MPLGTVEILSRHRRDQLVLVVHVQNGGAGGAMVDQSGNSSCASFGQRLFPHERVHELAVAEILDAVAHGADRIPPSTFSQSKLVAGANVREVKALIRRNGAQPTAKGANRLSHAPNGLYPPSLY